ncbi:aromatic acid exporter family protein [Paenibacillus sacheonensis]|uniref:Aromatic acid exporter family protein n=1 Tax=Paenibacillus sacheonensis TaxID=742054 RepID=A0A7X4YKN9_9BACL|nr:aromatic acid exporter family protein [Paenibacillus sacheonensis]NBC68052.1 aromatic acid exporter family protein [Paenibacillus sacheonensis]
MGIRVIKTAIAALGALYTAYYLGLNPALSAGLLAILGVEVTRLRGLKSAFTRFMASVIGLFFASVLFMTFGFHLWTISIFILLAFPILSRAGLKDGIATSSVIVFHVYAREEVTLSLIGNEVMLLLTGLGWATLINLIYMPKDQHILVELRHKTEENFAIIFRTLARTLRDPSFVWGGEELLFAGRAIEEGIRRAEISRENRIWQHGNDYRRYWSRYFDMRQQQLEAIGTMLGQLAFVYEKLPQGELTAELFDHLSGDVKSEVYEGGVEERIKTLEGRFRAMPLPATRDEFEMRAALLHLLLELKRYLAIAKRLKKQKDSLKTASERGIVKADTSE